MYRALAMTVGLLTSTAAGADCWVAGNFEGRSAMSESYGFVNDTFSDGMLICFTENGGHVSGNDLQMVRLGESTLVGWASNGRGLETVNSYQIDRERGKVLITQSRIGTATHISVLPDYAAAYVGDAAPAR